MPDITSRGRCSECLTHVLAHLTILSTPILQKSKLRHGALQFQRQSTAPPLLFHQVAVGWFAPPAPALSPPSSPALSFPSPTTHSVRLGPCEVSAVTAFPSLITSQPRCWVDQRQLLPRPSPERVGQTRDRRGTWLGGASSIHHQLPNRKATGQRSLGVAGASCRGPPGSKGILKPALRVEAGSQAGRPLDLGSNCLPVGLQELRLHTGEAEAGES